MQHLNEIEQVDRQVLEIAFVLALGALSCYGRYRNMEPQNVAQELIDEAGVLMEKEKEIHA